MTALVESLLADDGAVRLPGLEDALTGEPVFRDVSPEGLLTVTVRGAQLPAPVLEKVFRFRLVQYLRRGWVDPAGLARRRLTHEPYDEGALRDVHSLCVEADTGRLRGYASLVAPRDPAGRRLGDPDHLPFVVERDYGLRLADHLGPDTPSAAVREGKRLVRDHAMRRSPAALSVSWWVLLGWATACLEVLASPAAAVVGDGKKRVTINQLRLLGFHTRTVDAEPLPPDPADLFAPMWDQTERSQPFLLTDGGALRPTLRVLHELLASGQAEAARTRLAQLTEARP
ncbi:hypothetical protein [Streptomyces sp. WM6386]|uniref:hypothetical protein n=1 Tax=Streptomyces sp. WM6386 TaxID=1415558 RepID=UPI000619A652|nr:hypothetical protein [Streptomyces sp. WM6386]KKD03475.1 hypothetical protein TN53_34925 [Streptomyces sp. WM6386]